MSALKGASLTITIYLLYIKRYFELAYGKFAKRTTNFILFTRCAKGHITIFIIHSAAGSRTTTALNPRYPSTCNYHYQLLQHFHDLYINSRRFRTSGAKLARESRALLVYERWNGGTS